MSDNKVIGRVLATEKCPTTIDKFTFWTKSSLILNPFDVVKIQHVNGSYSYGVIEDIAHIIRFAHNDVVLTHSDVLRRKRKVM